MRPILLLTSRLYLLLAVLAGVPTGASRTVVCVAPDRHVAIETVEGRCMDDAPTAGGAIGNTAACTMPDDCGDCADLPVGEQILSQAHRALQSTDVQSAPPTPVYVRGIDADCFTASANRVAARVAPSPHLAPPSRTTVLRI